MATHYCIHWKIHNKGGFLTMGKKMYSEEYINLSAIAIQNKLGTTERFTLQEFPEKINSIGSDIEDKGVNFYDYDGTLLYSYTVEEARNMSSLPALPEHDDLTCEGWNWTLEQIKALKTFVNVGANYITTDGATRIVLEVDRTCTQQLTFKTNVSEGVSIDWGDGSEIETSSTTGMKSYTHDYEAGRYTIKLIPLNSSVQIHPAGTVIGYGTDTQSSYTKNMIKEFLCGSGVVFDSQYTFGRSGLKYLALSRTIQWGTWVLFYGAFNLRCVVMPPNKPISLDQCFGNCFSLKTICTAFGSTVNSFNTFANDYSLESFVDIDDRTFNRELLNMAGASLKRVSYAVNITTCANRLACTNELLVGLTEIYLLAQTQVPTYASSFGQPYTTYYVPSSLYDEWIATDGWADVSDRIVPIDI